jgi:beta-galactosidase
LTLPIPVVEGRAEGELVLSLSVGGKEVFKDTKAVSVLNPAAKVAGDGKTLAVFDPAGTAAAYLNEHGVAFTSLADLTTLPESARTLLIGKNALDPTESASSRLAAYASAGRSVIVLEQKNPLRFQALPAEMEAESNSGRVGFAEDLNHLALASLKDKDLFTWGPDEVLYRNAYRKPTRGARSLVQCGDTLRNSALVQVPAGQGVLLLSQLAVGEKVAGNAVAQQLLLNLIAYGSTYKQVYRSVQAAVNGSPILGKTLDAVGLKYDAAEDVLAAIAKRGSVAVIFASPANLKTLAENAKKVEEFTQSGGWIVLSGLTPEGLASYNRLVGWDHVIRPFKRERVTLAPARRPVMAGVTGGDVTMYSSKRVFDWTEGNYVVSDEFTYVVDYDEIAPFCKSSFFAFDNIVNGFVNADGWPLIINFPVNKDGSPSEVPIQFPKEETVTEFTWIGNTNYWPQTKINLVFGKDKRAYTVPPTGDPQALPVDPPATARQMTLQIAGWKEEPGKGALVGIDNIAIKVKRPAEFYEKVKPLLSVGGMMEYPRGKGGFLLCNLNFQEREEVPVNADKKRAILAAVLRNLNAPFAAKSVIAGANLEYKSVDLSKQANAFRDEKGWFGDMKFTFRDLPTGKHVLAGVPYEVYEFATSPVPTVVMIDGPGVPGKLPAELKGIPVNAKADALFFLMAARVDKRPSPDDRKKGKPQQLARYLVHYADGKTAEVPIDAEVHVDDYRQKTPAAVPGAQVAWTRQYEGTDQSAVAYSVQWTNPRPEVVIASIDLLPGKDRAGVPALLALTTATGK